MFSREIQSKISDIFVSLAEAERDVEITRQVLTENKEYNSYQIFCYLDSDKKNYIGELDIINYLKSKNVFSTEIEAKLLILFYDNNLDTNLNFEEFVNLIESKLSHKRENNEIKIEGVLSFSIDYSLTKLLEKEIIHARKILRLLEDLHCFSEFEIHNIFHLIKNNNNINSITNPNLIQFLNRNHASFIEQDIDLIFKRIDFNKDKAIDLCEFHIFFGFPNCGYNCPFEKCINCGIECCQTCRIDEPCYVHKFINKRNNNYIPKNVYRTYYTEFQNRKNENKENNVNIQNKGFSSEVDNQFNNGIKNITQNLTLKIFPKREYEPFEICLGSDINDNIIYINNKEENNNTSENNNNNYKMNDYNFSRDNNNTLNQNFETNENKIVNSQNNNELIKSQNNIKSDDFNKNKEFSNNINTNHNLINAYNNIKNKQNEGNRNKNENEENQFIDYLKEAMLHECKIENIKIQLSLRSDFNWEKVFRIFELEGRGFLSKEDLIKGFNKLGIFPNDLDLSLLFKRYDLKKEGYLSYPNFFDLIVPFSKYHRIMVDKRKINDENISYSLNDFSQETLNCIRDLFVAIFKGEFILNKIKENFTSLKIKMNDIFELLDPMKKGFFGEKELAVFLQKNGIFNTSNDCDLLFLRLNKLRNGKIYFKEIFDEIEEIYE